MAKVDQDQSGYIEYEEFLRAVIDQKTFIDSKYLQITFESFDNNHDGKLDTSELKKIFGTNKNDYIEELIKGIDENKDGKLSFSEFEDLMRKVVFTKTKNDSKII